MMRKITLIGLLACASAVSVGVQARELMPTSYEAGHFFVNVQVKGDRNIRLLVDTGGPGGTGLYLLSSDAIKRLGLPLVKCDWNGMTSLVKPFQTSKKGALPTVPGTPCKAVALIGNQYQPTAGEDGILGAGYLPHFIWTFDYPARQLWLEPANWKPSPAMRRAELRFLDNAKGKKGSGFARITVTVDGKPLPLLLDTGATAEPTFAGERASGTPTFHEIGVTSYITTRVLDQWHRDHPKWPIVTDADRLIGEVRIIRVPRVTVAGWNVGPVWFTERATEDFALPNGLSRYMDQPIDGALGANVLRQFVMTIDYPHDAAWLACHSRCKLASSRQ